MLSSRKRVITAGVILAAILFLAPTAYRVVTEDKARLSVGDGGFQRIDLGDTLHLFAIGAADFDGDGLLDLFTNNHFLAERYFRNEGDLRFSDDRVGLGLSSNHEFPNAEISPEAPTLDRPGLYIFWQDGDLRLVSQGLPAATSMTLTLIGGVIANPSGAVRVMEPGPETPGQDGATRIDLRFEGDGSVRLASLQWAVNGSVELDPGADLSAVFVGRDKVTPLSRNFELMPGADRHGMAWIDLDGDARTDVVTVLGGEVGRMTAPQPYPVYFGAEGGFDGPRTLPGLVQELCPSRQVLLGDANGDGWDDVYVVCGRGSPPRVDHPNELFIRTAPETFENRAASFGLDLPGQGMARWFDADGDGRAELLWVTDAAISVLARHGDRYETVFSAARAGTKTQVAAGDIDGDGSVEFFIAALSGQSVVLRTAGGNYSLVEPDSLGLPRSATCAGFVDYDNDGVMDFHALPDGLFRRPQPGENFAATGLLASGPYPAFCMWVDVDNDGFPDLLTALPATDSVTTRAWRKLQKTYEGIVYRNRYTGRIYRPERWTLSLYRTRPADNNWLAVDLAGPPGNPAGLGAVISVVAAGDRFTQEVGPGEGSVSSHGHFRSYFGLGARSPVEAVTVRWPDGLKQQVPQPGLNRLIRIVRPPTP